MKRCNTCDRIFSEKIITCPACGAHLVEGLRYIDEYRIQTIIHEGRSSIVCKARKDDSPDSVSIRLFTKKSGVDQSVAQRLETELIELKKLPKDHFVQHHALRQSRDGDWYRVSEWVNAMDWGSIFMSGMLNDQRSLVTLFHNIASVLDLLNKQGHFMPYLILDDILIPKKNADRFPVKINFKLSGFLNAKATHHGPMLKKLLDCHPDIRNERAINFKSGIWSLGKIFVEILSADPNTRDFSSSLDACKGLDPELKTLIKLMLSDDPGLRPQTMKRVVTALAGILNRLNTPCPKPEPRPKKPILLRELLWFKRVVVLLIFIICGIVGFGTVSWFQISSNDRKPDRTMSQFVESYAGSVAFLMVEYWLNSDDKTIYRNKVEGTAFLADKNGYLLTNRHVACPWLEDNTLYQIYSRSIRTEESVEFGYKLYLWFEGQKAFKRLPELGDSTELSDDYHLDSAYSSGGRGNLRIVGIPRSPVKTGELFKSPFQNDFAVLKIDDLPETRRPLPLGKNIDVTAIKRLSSVVILGFPLGNRTQADYINTSITRGHVRRSTKEIIQVDTSIYSGNSGGPAIDEQGRVIGIASGVITDSTSGYLKITRPLSDFGLILPIERPAALIESIKKGHPHWNGVIDLSLRSKLKEITDLAVDNRFKEAAQLSEKMLKESNDPVLINVSGLLYFCTGDLKKAKTVFRQLSMIEPENTTARLLLYIIDWIQNAESSRSFTDPLFSMGWHEEDEFIGYLATVLRNQKRLSSDGIDYENRSEMSWRSFIEGLVAEKNNEMDQAEKMFELSILNAGINDWVYFLSFSRLNQIRTGQIRFIDNKQAHTGQIEAFHKRAKQYRVTAQAHSARMARLIRKFRSDSVDLNEKQSIGKELRKLAPENRSILGEIAFFHATNGNWQEAIDSIDLFFSHPVRQTGLSLSLGLLKGQLLDILSREKESQTYMTQWLATIRDPWYRTITEQLLDTPDENALIELAGNRPEKLITLHTALGLRAEKNNRPEKATHHYKEALSSYLNDWNQYDLARGRIIAIRKEKK